MSVAQINRYVTWPGQACGYKIGQMKIRELRTKAEAALGASFNIKEFHEVRIELISNGLSPVFRIRICFSTRGSGSSMEKTCLFFLKEKRSDFHGGYILRSLGTTNLPDIAIISIMHM